MKKSIVILLIVLAVIVVISPGIVGKLAEQTVDENLNWAAEETREVVVTSQNFDRGWFSSEGQHRVELREGRLRDVLMMILGTEDATDLPALIIDTHIDHGLIPVTSMTRDKGSLAPGLGNAVSTLRIENPEGDPVEVPGKIFSTVGLGGGLRSNYVLETGSASDGNQSASWGAVDIVVETDAAATAVGFDGSVESLELRDDEGVFTMTRLRVSGEQKPSGYGFFVGDVAYSVDVMAFDDGQQVTMSPISVTAATHVKDGKLAGEGSFSMTVKDTPNLGDVGMEIDTRLSGIDAVAFQAFVGAARSLDPTVTSPGERIAGMDQELKQLLAGGLAIDFDKLNVTMAEGTVETTINLLVKESDSADFEWTTLLLATEAEANVRVPEAVMDLIIEMNPQAGAAVGLGYLKKNGDVYEMQAAYKKGLLTINGAPMPIPMP